MEIKRCLEFKVVSGDFEFRLYIPEGPSWGKAIEASMELSQMVQNLASQEMKKVLDEIKSKNSQAEVEAIQ